MAWPGQTCLTLRIPKDARGSPLHVPGTPSELVRDSVDQDFWDPIRNLREREVLGDEGDEGKCLLVSVGEKDPDGGPNS